MSDGRGKGQEFGKRLIRCGFMALRATVWPGRTSGKALCACLHKNSTRFVRESESLSRSLRFVLDLFLP
jgi:hypothetical protein